MATITNTREGVKYTNDLLAANNPVGLISCLKKEEIIVPQGSTEILLSNLMDAIFNNEKEKWIRIVKCTPYNANAGNWTTTADTLNDVRDAIFVDDDANAKFDISGIFTQIGDFIGGSSTSGGGSTTKGNQAVGIAAVIIVGAITGVALWLIFKK